jgi:outer membrane receptor protein involved in Fe transport
MKKYQATASLAVLAFAAAPGWAVAQSAQEARSGTLVEEIVVTAQKREQSLQDVPIVVTAIGQRLLQDTGVRDVKDLTQVTPGLMVTSTSNETNTVARIRGVGTIGDNAGLESSVGIVVDGVYRPRAGTGIGDLGELQRVEVLKGPQGTLFGKNTSAGVINVITAEPSFDFGAEAVATLGNYGAKELSVSVTGPLIEDKLAGRIYVAGRKRDGFYDVIRGNGSRANDEDNNRNYWTARGQLLFTPTEDLSIRTIVDFTQRNESCCLAATLVRGPAGRALDLASGVVASDPNADGQSRTVYANRGGPNDVRDKGVSVEANWNTPWLNNATLTSISAWRNWRTIIGQESDFSAADIIYRDQNGDFATEFEQYSQELRLAGEAGKLNWLVGAFYAKEDLDQSSPLLFGNDMERFLSLRFSGNASSTFLGTLTGLPTGTVFTPTTGTLDVFHQESRTAALFTNNSLAITEQLELTVGLRYTQEQKTLAAAYSNVGTNPNSCAAAVARQPIISGIIGAAGYGALLGAVCAPFNDPGFKAFTSTQKQTAEETTGTVKLAYRFNPDLLTYVSYARGYKSGGFNLDRARFGVGRPNPDTFFAAEFVDSYEVGAKSTLLGGSLLLNGAIFWQEFDNFQLNTYTGISYVVSSIPKVVSRGVDTDIMWRTPIEGLRLQGGVTYAETQYGSFTPGAGVSPRLPNSRLSGAPLYSGSLSGTYDRELTDNLTLHTNLNVRYTSSYNTGSDLNPLKVQKEAALVNARVGIGSADDTWRVEAWAANLTDEDTSQVVFDTPLQTGSLGTILSAPRTYGLTLRLSY